MITVNGVKNRIFWSVWFLIIHYLTRKSLHENVSAISKINIKEIPVNTFVECKCKFVGKGSHQKPPTLVPYEQRIIPQEYDGFSDILTCLCYMNK